MTESAIDNPLFEEDPNSLQSVEVKSAEDQVLTDPAMNPAKNFAQEFATFFKLKIAIWVLILLLAISQIIALIHRPDYSLRLERWSNWHTHVIVPNFEFGYQIDALNYMTALTWLWFLPITFSLVMHYLKRKNVEKCKNFLSCLALMDVCFWAIFFLNIPIIFLSYAHRTITEYLWFYPRLMNGTSLNELTEYTSYRSYKSYYDAEYWYRRDLYSTTPSTTAIPIIALLVIVLSIVYIWRIRSAIKRTNLLESDYKKLYPQCSELDAGYAKFWPIGMLKVIHWIVPVFLCLGPFYDFSNSRTTVIFKISIACCFAVFLYRWISYIKTVRFRNENLNEAPKGGLGSHLKVDSFICLLGITFYVVWCVLISGGRGRDADRTQIVAMIAISSLVCSFLANVRLMHKYNGLFLNAPLVSVNVSIKINKEKITIVRSGKLNAEENETEEEKNIWVNV